MDVRRGTLIAVLVAAIAVPAAAAATTSKFKGSVVGDENSKVTFKVIKNENGKRRVDVPKAKRLDATCEMGPNEIDATFGSLGNIKVSQSGEFNFDNSGEKYVAYVRGTISGKSASGVLHFQGPTNFDGAAQDCDTGEVNWTAKKV